MKFWKSLNIKSKIVYPIVAVSLLSGLFSYFYFRNLYKETETNALVTKARTLILEAEAVRNLTSDQHKMGVFKDSIDNLDTFLHTVPIFTAMQVAEEKSKELGMELKVPKKQPRNPKNEPDAYELEILNQLETGNIPELWAIDEETDAVRYFRPVVLTEECLKCHGDPARSMEYWGRSDGTDITGKQMENWRAGEIHGAFEIKMPMKPVNEAVFNKSIVIAIISLITVGLISMLGFFVANKISASVGKLEKAANMVASGNLNVVIEKESDDEIGNLSNSFNKMINDIKTANHLILEEKASVEKKVEEAVRESESARKYLSEKTSIMLRSMEKFANGDLSQRLTVEKNDDIGKLYQGFNDALENITIMISKVTDAVYATASASSEISASAEQMADGASEQRNQTREVAAAIEEMTKTILSTAGSTEEAANAARNAKDIANVGENVVTQTIQGMNQIAEVVTKAAKTVEILGTNSDKIGEIIQVINEIAEQTNLLALNAAIEAARAGEQGRGFAVVADEVRKLAERTSKATKEIESMIKQIQNDTEGAVDSMQRGTSEVENGKKLASQAGNSLKQIINATEKVLDVASQVATASEEQSATAEEISKSIDIINNVSHQSAESIQQVAVATEDLNRLTNNLQNLIQQFKIDNSPIKRY